MSDLWGKSREYAENGRILALAAWSRTTRRMQLTIILAITFAFSLYLTSFPTIRSNVVPTISLDHHEPPPSPYNATKVALLIENRPNPVLAPLMLHFISVVPPDWRFRFMGSIESVQQINKSVAIREQVSSSKLDLTYIPANMSTMGQEKISEFLTTLWLYETVLAPAEFLLVFQTDSVLCANSRKNLNDYLDYDWVGAPWRPDSGYGGNGGLSLRRVSAIIEVLRDQIRIDGSEPEDVWLSTRLGNRPGARMANGTIALTFSGEGLMGEPEKVHKVVPSGYNSTEEAAAAGEYVVGIDDWRDGFYEPMGYHIGTSGSFPQGASFGQPKWRQHVWDYCPEIKMAFQMDVAQYVPGNCNAYWKRDLLSDAAIADMQKTSAIGWPTEIIDGVEYPMLPETLQAW